MKPYVICHMMTSLDGRIVTDRWDLGAGLDEYDRTGDAEGADAWMCGRITMEAFAGDTWPTEHHRRVTGETRPDHVRPRGEGRWAVALDAKGRLRWQENTIGGDAVVAVLTETVGDDYLEFLRAKGISYVFAGAAEVDLSLALEKLSTLLGVKRLLLEGGGKVNGAMLRAGLIDELSLLCAPVADGAIGNAALFDVEDLDPAWPAPKFALLAVERVPGDVVWLRYRVLGTPTPA